MVHDTRARALHGSLVALRAVVALAVVVAVVIAVANLGCSERSLNPDSGTGGASGAAGAGGGQGGHGGNTLRCTFAATYVWNDQHVSRFGTETSGSSQTASLSPPTDFSSEAASFTNSTTTTAHCSAPLPTCGDPNLSDVSDIEAAIAHPDVQAAFAQGSPPMYGSLGVADLPDSYSFKLGGQVEFSGVTCLQDASCIPMPAGVAALVDRLRALVVQQFAHPSCAGSDAGAAF